jgi:hypothetical protein
MKKLYPFILLILLSFSASAQIVEISANPGSSGNIVIGQSNYHVSESIYLDSEIGASNFLTSGTSITKIAFSVNANTSVVFPVTINNVKISIKNTTATSLASGTNNTTGYTVVFSGSITFSGIGWKTIVLSTAFVRTAGQNLQLKIERSNNLSNSALVFDAAMGNNTSSTASSSRRYNGTASITTNTTLTPTFFRPSIQLIRPFPTDAQAIGIINPVNSCFSTNQTIKVAVRNNGTTAILAGAASVNLSITGANTSITTSTNTSNIPVDSTVLVVFNGINLNSAGLNQETAIVNVASDGYRANDTATSSVTTATILSFLPQTEDVEGQFNVFAYLKAVVGTNAWTVLSFISNTGAFNNGWSLDSLTTRPNGTGADFFVFDSYDAAPGTVSRLFSNCISLPSTGASRVSFWMSHDSAFATNLDSLYVAVSNNKGVSWTRIKGFRRPDASLIEYTWLEDSVDISAYNGQTIQLAFEGVSAFGNAFGLDDINIYNIVNICLPTYNSTTITSCNSYTWVANNNTIYNTSGTYIKTYINSCGVASADTLKLTINQGSFSSITRTACVSYNWSANGQTYSNSGTYIRNYTNASGCPSADTLRLTINQGTFTSTSLNSCGTYTWSINNQTYTTSGTYIRNYTNGLGCTSADTLKLTINTGTFNSNTITSCGSYFWSANGQTYNSSGVYVRTYNNANGCSSADTLKLTINQSTYTSTTVTNCGSYLWIANGQTYTNSGIYIRNYINSVGCNSADTLKLTINQGTFTSTTIIRCGSYTWTANGQTYNASGVYIRTYNNLLGCPSADTLKLTINQGTFTSFTVNNCGTYTWSANGVSYSSSGTYVRNYTNSQGCSSADTLKLTINQGTFTSTTIVRCETYTWSINNQTYTASGTYIRTYNNTEGCFSADTLKLTINYGTYTSTSVTNCESYVWNGNTYTTSGVYTKNYVNGSGCPSVDTLKLRVNYGTYTSTSVTNCESYVWNGNIYTLSGIYTKNYVNASGCASVDTLKLTINRGTFTSTNVTNCGSYVWNGNTYTSSGTYTKNYFNGFSCLSLDTLKLIINQGTFTSTTIATCGSYIWNGFTYTTSGTFTKNYTNGSGCASTDTLYLSITPAINNSTIANSCGSYLWNTNGNTYTTSGIYYYNNLNCGTTDTLKLTINQGTFTSTSVSNCISYVWNGNTYTTSGIYTSVYTNGFGCTSVDTLNLTINKGTYTSTTVNNCYSYTWPTNGQSYSASGNYIYTYFNSLGCQSADTLKLTINQGTHTSINITNCNSYTWLANGQTYTASGIYTRVYTNGLGCTSVDTLKLTINGGSYSSTTVTNCDSYTWPTNGQTYNVSGNYIYSYFNNLGCLSADTLKLTITQATYTSASVTTCGSYTWPVNGQSYTSSGIYTRVYTNGLGCTSVDTLKLTINQGTYSSNIVSNCDSYTWPTNGQTYNATGNYIYTYFNSLGCPSADTLKLTINQGTFTSTTVTNCDSYTWSANGQAYTASGIYTRVYTNGLGCTSIDTLKLTINQGSYSSTTVTNCYSYTWPRNGQIYNASGNYIYTYFNSLGCPSADTLKLTIAQATYTSASLTTCGSYTWPVNGQTYTISGTYVRNYTNSNNCASVDTLHLTISQGTFTSTAITACDSYIWNVNGQVYTTSGIYIYSYNNNLGCPSADTLKLIINQGSFTSTSVTTCENYTWQNTGLIYDTTGTYIRNYTNGLDCPSADTLHLWINHASNNSFIITSCDEYTWPSNGQTYTTSGTYTRTYTNGLGCPSTDTLSLTINNHTDSTETVTSTGEYIWPLNGELYTESGTYYYTISETNSCTLVKLILTISNVNIYPNPTTGIIKLNLSNLEIPNGMVVTISVYDRIGRLVKKQTNLPNTLNEVDLTPYSNGLYIIRVQTPEKIYFSSKMIKQSFN